MLADDEESGMASAPSARDAFDLTRRQKRSSRLRAARRARRSSACHGFNAHGYNTGRRAEHMTIRITTAARQRIAAAAIRGAWPTISTGERVQRFGERIEAGAQRLPRAYSYVRFSTPEQAKGHSLQH